MERIRNDIQRFIRITEGKEILKEDVTLISSDID